MRVFVDTSALLSVIDADESHHVETGSAWADAIVAGWHMTTTNYVALECIALVQHRLGIDAARVLCDDVLPAISIHWVGATEHDAGVTAMLTARRRRLSLVDCVSFAVMRRLGLETALCLDQHFEEQGFACIPERATPGR